MSLTAPICSIGDVLDCKRLGRRMVVGFRGDMNWPYLDRVQHSSPFVNDELLDALRRDSMRSCCRLFGISSSLHRRLCVEFGIPTRGHGFLSCDERPARELFFGPYQVPDLKVGDEADCLVYGHVSVSGFNGPICWPASSKGKRNLALIVTDELLRALRRESNAGFAYWFGISEHTCCRLRRRFGIDRTCGSSREMRRAASVGRPRIKWTDEMLSLLGTQPDFKIAKRFGVSQNVVFEKRTRLGILRKEEWSKKCVQCGRDFMSLSGSQKYCSRKCGYAFARNVMKERYALGRIVQLEQQLSKEAHNAKRIDEDLAAKTG